MNNKLTDYTEAFSNLQLFRQSHPELREMEKELQIAEVALKEEIRKTGHDEVNDIIEAKYIPVHKKFYDYNAFEKIANRDEKAIATRKGAIKHEINFAAFNKLFEEGKISAQTRQKAFREEKGTPRIIIKEI